MPKVCTPRFLVLVGRQKVLLQTTLRMLLELVFTTSPHPFGSSFSELRGHGGELDTRPSVVLCSTRLCASAKLEVGAGTCLICRRCGGVIGSNAVAFTGGGVGDVRVDLSVAEGAVNAEITENLLCFAYNDREGDEVPSGVTDPSGEETFSTVFFRHPGL